MQTIFLLTVLNGAELLNEGLNDHQKGSNLLHQNSKQPSSSYETDQLDKNPSTRPTVMRRATDVPKRGNILRVRNPARLKARHSFLSGLRPDATLSTRLSYDFSSLDTRTIEANGIIVHHQLPNDEDAANTRRRPVSSTEAPPALAVVANGLSPVDQPSSPTTTVELGLAAVMQRTGQCARTRPKRVAEPFTFSRSRAPVTFTNTVVGPRAVLPWTPAELAERLDVFNANEFGLLACKVSLFVCVCALVRTTRT